MACVDESELLTAFWDVAKHYETVVTFNGRGFDVPFIYLRSALLNVPISRKDWLGYRFQTDPHCDLAEQLTFYGVSGREGAARRFNLDFYCKAFGIESPKSHGVTGLDVGSLLAAGPLPGDRRILPARRQGHRSALPDLEEQIIRDQVRRSRMCGNNAGLLCGENGGGGIRQARLGQAAREDAGHGHGLGQCGAERPRRLGWERPGLVLSCGFAGGLDPRLATGTVVYAADAQTGLEPVLLAAGARPARFHCANEVACTAASKRAARAMTGADAVEMESQVIRALCREQTSPARRCVSSWIAPTRTCRWILISS